jgi:hypothetical protein
MECVATKSQERQTRKLANGMEEEKVPVDQRTSNDKGSAKKSGVI